MNIFFVDNDPVRAAQCLVDQHVNKMVTETAQILSNVYNLEHMENDDCPKTLKGTSRKHSYPHHPCCKWTQESFDNFDWVVRHGLALEEERLYRGFKPSHSAKFIQWCSETRPSLPYKGLTPPAQAFGPEWEHLCGDDPVEAYRRYYNVAKREQSTLRKVWTKRIPPQWWESDDA